MVEENFKSDRLLADGDSGNNPLIVRKISAPKESEMVTLRKLNGSANGSVSLSIENLRRPPKDFVVNRKTITLTHVPRRPAIDIEFKNLSYTVTQGRRKEKKLILKELDGKFKSGELTAIMGPSGAGKSSLMNILAGYRITNVSGSVLINDKNRNPRKFRKMSCYIMQDDCLTPLLTVEEAMNISVRLKVGNTTKEETKKHIVKDILEALSLNECSGTMTACLSGGQRKRLSIALELVNNPPVMFFDEPTSGLDSSSCFQCICLLKSLARGGRTVICTIHQPSARLFEMFDHLYMLVDGFCMYKGNVPSLVPFMAGMGFHCPEYHNPADYVMEVACGEHGDCVDELVTAVTDGACDGLRGETVRGGKLEGNGLEGNRFEENSLERKSLEGNRLEGNGLEGNKLEGNKPKGNKSKGNHLNCTKPEGNKPEDLFEDDLHSRKSEEPSNCNSSLLGSKESIATFPTSTLVQFWVLLKRTFISTFRDPQLTRLRLIAHVAVGAMLGGLYWNIGNDAAKVQSNMGCIFFMMFFTLFASMMPTILTFPMERPVFMKEHLNYWYSLKSYYFAKTFSDIPFQVLMTSAFVLVVYFMTSQPYEVIRVFMFLFINILTSLNAQSIGLIVGTAFDVEVGTFIGPITTIPLILFSGYFIRLGDIPWFLRWLTYVSMMRYSLEGCMVAIYGLEREKLPCNQAYCHFKYPERFMEQMSMEGNLNTYFMDVGVLVFFFFVLRVGLYFLLRVKIKIDR